MANDNRTDKTGSEPDANRDPITNEPGAHPLGTAGGSAAGAAAGAALGSIAGPVGTLVGGAVGAIAGGLAGKGAAEGVNPTVEDTYWRDNYKTRPYATDVSNYDDVRPAYQYGWESRDKYQGKQFNDVETDLERGWESAKGSSKLGWDKAKDATRDAWDRVERAMPGDADGDGR